MDIGYILLLTITLLGMLFGLVGAALPIIPGLPIVWVMALIYGIFTGFEEIGATYLITFGILTAIVLVMDYLAAIYGAKRLGASRWGIIGAIVGTIVGIIVGGPVGLIFGPLIGAVVFELLIGREFRDACKAGFGTFCGYVAGAVMKLVLSL
ncbi:MAG: DUF456 domain-containing protein, partial [bacterium]